MSKQFKKLSYSIYEYKYHIIFCPKYPHRIFDSEIADYTRQQIYQLLRQKDSVEVLELNIQPYHIHLATDIVPKYAVSMLMGYLKDKLPFSLFSRYERLGRHYWGRHLWARGYYVMTVGIDEEIIRQYQMAREAGKAS